MILEGHNGALEVDRADLTGGDFNAVLIATMHNTVYVYDADKENRGPQGRTTPLWATWLGPPRPGGKDIDMWSTNDPEWGILSTPVMSDDKSTLYVVAWHDDGPAGLQYRLHALNLSSGTDRHPPVVIGKSSVDPSQPCQRESTFNPCVHKQRTASMSRLAEMETAAHYSPLTRRLLRRRLFGARLLPETMAASGNRARARRQTAMEMCT